MISEKIGRIVKGLGGLYETRVVGDGGEIERILCRAKGSLHRDEEKLLVGDIVRISVDTETPDGVVISECLERKNALIRPPLANLDFLFIVFAAAKPAPVLETVDKLTAIAEHNGIRPVIVISKKDVSAKAAEEYEKIYRAAGLDVFETSSKSGEGISALSEYVHKNVTDGALAAFAGASGVGKSTLINALFGNLSLATAEISKKIERGRHTTRHVEIFDITPDSKTGHIADTPGFSLIDFARFDFFSAEDLEAAFPDISRYRGRCRYADCAHFGEGEGECAVLSAARSGELPMSRLDSYRAIYKVLKSKNSY